MIHDNTLSCALARSTYNNAPTDATPVCTAGRASHLPLARSRVSEQHATSPDMDGMCVTVLVEQQRNGGTDG